jgi:hypothetical protein
MTAAAAAFLLLAAAASADTLVEKLDRTYPLEGRTVSVENVNGSVEVGVWDRPEVRVEAEKRLRGARRDATAEALASVRIEVEQTSSALKIRTRHPNRHGFDFFDLFTNGRVHAVVNYRITMPRTARLEVDTVNATIRVAGVLGGTAVETVNGAIEVTGGAGPFTASTVNGSIDAALSDVPEGKLSASSVNGKIRLALPAALRANVDVSTVNGKITSDIPVTARSMSRRSLKGEMNGGGRVDISISTVNGSVTIEPN